MSRLRRRHRNSCFTIAISAWLVLCTNAVPLVADPLVDIMKAAGLSGVTPVGLHQGEIYSERGTQGSFARGAYAQSCYFVKASAESVKSALLHWDPSRYKEAGVDAYASYRWPTAPETFQKFQLSLKRANDKQLIDATVAAAQGDSGSLHLRAADGAVFRPVLAGSAARDGLVSASWQQILQQRNDAMAAGGLAGLPAYQAGDVSIRAADEYRSLLKMAPSVASNFSALTAAKPLFAEGAASVDEVSPYAEQSQVNGHTSLCLGVLAAHQNAGAWQVLDCTYYTADTYFLSLSLYQLQPWENGTLVWQIDYVSAPFRSYLGGLDRVFAGKEMTKDSARAVRLFRREVEGHGH